jgi:hypothetical protein
VQCDGVAERDEIGRPLRGCDTGDAGDRKRVARASRAVTSLLDTSTIRAAPWASTWVS